jgi:ankyrin repeat protein
MEQQAACLRQNEAIDPHVDEDAESSHGEAAAKSEAETHHDAQLGDYRQERGTTRLPESEPDPDSDRGPELESAILDAAQTNPARLLELDLTGAATQTILHNQKQTLLESLVANRDSTSEILLTVLRYMKCGCDEGGDKVENDALSLALTQGRADLAKALLDNGINLSQTRDSGHKALWRACEHGLVEIVSLLLESGADLMENCDLEGDTPLGVACHHGQEEVVSLLLADSRIDLDKSDDMGWTPLNTAAIKGHTNIVAKLLAKGAKINLATEFGWTPLATACRNGNEETVSLLLTREDIEIDARDDDGFTPLNAAADNGHASIVSKLLAKGAAVDISSNSGWIPLTAACQQGYVETIKALVADERTDINGQDGAGWTPLGMASQHGREDAVNFLLAHRAIDIDRVDREGWTALKNASHHGRVRMVDLLLNKGAQVDIPDNKGWTALMGASKWGHYGICRRLLEHHANVNLANSEKSIALHWASHRGYANLVTLLVENKADRSLRNQDGCTPLHLASQQGYAEAVVALLDQHKDVADACDHQGWTALHKASFHKDADVERLKIEEGDVKPDWDHEPVSQHHRVVELLLQHNTDIACTTLTNDTPLLLAAKQGNTKCLQQLVARMAEGDINRRDYKSHTALYYAASSRDADMLRAVLERVTAADFGPAGTYMEQEALVWAADDGERHQLFAMVAQKGSVMTKKNVPDTHRESALCWAVWNADLELVCRILNSSASDSNAAKDRKSVEAVASRMLAGMKSADVQRSRNPQTKANALKNLDRKAQRDGDHRKKEQPTASAAERDKYETILDLLRNPPIVPTTVSIQPCEMPVLGADIDIGAFDATVVDFYAKEKSSGFLRRERGIKEVIYDPESGPNKLMAAAQETMKAQSHYLGSGDVYSPADFKFRWIHLPANNVSPSFISSTWCRLTKLRCSG